MTVKAIAILDNNGERVLSRVSVCPDHSPN